MSAPNISLSLAIVKENLLKGPRPWAFDALGQAVVQEALSEVIAEFERRLAAPPGWRWTLEPQSEAWPDA